MSRLNEHQKAIFFASLIAVLVVAAYAAGILIPDSAVEPDFMNAKLAPGLLHPFGTDWLGRDLFLRTIKGLSVSLTVGFTASAVSAMIAMLVGIGAAMGSKRVDGILNWVIDLVMGIPHLVLVILVSFACGRGLKGLLAGIAVTHWTALARLIRGEVMQLRNQKFITISRHLGKSNTWILTRHLLPHLVPQFLVGMVLLFPHAILHESAISFLGYGLPPEQPAIGIILSESMKYLSSGMWWLAVCPGLLLMVVVLLIDRLGEHLRIILDPAGAQK